MKIRSNFFIILTAAILMLFSGCTAPELFIHGYKGENGKIKVAAVLPLSGTNRIMAEQMKEGLLLAEQDINSNSAYGRKRLEFRILDSKGTPEGTRAAMTEAKQWGASGIVAGYSSSEVSAILPYVATMQMPTVIPLATATEHTMFSPYIYRNSYTDFQQSEMLANYLVHWRQAKYLGIFIDETGDTSYQGNISRDVSQIIRNIGGAVTATMIVKKQPDERNITDMLKTDPEAILLTYGGKAAAETIKKLRRAGFTGIVCGADNWDNPALIDALDDFKVGECLYTAFFNDENTSAEYVRFKTAFRKRFYHNPGACETQSYDALRFLVIGLDNAETLPQFDKNWRKIRRYQGVAALYTMLPKGEIDRTIYINSIGVKRVGSKIKPFARLSHKLQYSKLKEYDMEYYQ